MVVWLMLLGVAIILGAMIIYVLYVVSSAYPVELNEDHVTQVASGQIPCPKCGCKRLDLTEYGERDEYRCSNCGQLRMVLGDL